MVKSNFFIKAHCILKIKDNAEKENVCAQVIHYIVKY